MNKSIFQTFLLFFLLVFSTILKAENYPHRSDVLWITNPNHSDWIYKTNEKAKVSVSLYHYGILLDTLTVKYSVAPELMEEVQSGVAHIKNGIVTIDVGTLKYPGFLDLSLKVQLGGEEFKHHIKVGFDPDKLTAYTKYPSDFDSFWKAAKEKADQCPMVVEKTFIPEYSSDKVNCYLVKIQAYEKSSCVYGYLTMPNKKGKFPVVFSPPGAGIKPMNPLKDIFYAESGFIRFDMEIHGIRPNLDKQTYDEISRAFGNKNNSYLVNGLDNKDNYYMKKVYLSCLRVIDYLTTLPEWDGKNIIAQGGSQGGALALITTALDSRITACAANHPALSDMARYKMGRAGGYPHLFTKFEGMDTPEKLNTLQYYDVVNFARNINVPVFMTWGFNDNTCPPTTSYIVYNTLNTQKEALIMPVTEHWISLTTRHSILDWIRTQLK
ncbi:acetylxylan esterase [Plebeiibacterium sediminum]|uniref:Acetylxylan esterase n=1 Tax=Plebeiibacterium sediminum TaxID=2992112 RepID=A0AAE3SEX1_9BACT|nr:acetylxylan esterase [Plebeiobacterium sediminum]MCW3785583.1 acetylxylan esterase [Plebeiobacterium sediminum]